MFTPQQIKEIRLSPVADHAMEDLLDGPKIFWKVNGGKSLSQKKFGRLIGWGDVTVARWESGSSTPSRANNLILDAWKSSSDFRYLVALRFQDYLREKKQCPITRRSLFHVPRVVAMDTEVQVP